MRSFLFWVLPALCALVACGGNSGGTPPDAQLVDLGPGLDQGDGGAPDLGVPDQAGKDLGGGEALLGDLASPDASSPCSYTVVDEVVVECSSVYTYVFKHSLAAGPGACRASYWAVKGKGGQHATPADAAAAAGCSTTCIWSKAISVSLLYCGNKTGYIRFDAPGCPSLFEFPDGYYPSFEAYQAAHPCLDGGASG